MLVSFQKIRLKEIILCRKETFMKNESKVRHVGDIVKELRAQFNWSQVNLAEYSGVSERTIQRLEKDGTAEYDTLLAVANAFKVDVEFLKFKPEDLPTEEDLQKLLKEFHFLQEVKTGKVMMDFVVGNHAMHSDHPQPKTDEEASMFGAFFENCQDWGDIWGDIPQGGRMDAIMAIHQQIEELNAAGFSIFSETRKMKMVSQEKDKEPFRFNTVTIMITPSDNPTIFTNEQGLKTLPVRYADTAYSFA